MRPLKREVSDQLSAPTKVECATPEPEPERPDGSVFSLRRTRVLHVPDKTPAPAPQIQLSDFIEAASRAALRAIDAHAGGEKAALNPQPLPPGATAAVVRPGRIFIGIIAAPEAQLQ
jgi:hypothetical protein